MSHNYHHSTIYKKSLALGANALHEFKDLKPFRLAEQVCASSISIASNIAEGALRTSNTDFKRFLTYASGSAAEFSTQMEILILSGEYDSTLVETFRKEAIEIIKMINAFKRQL